MEFVRLKRCARSGPSKLWAFAHRMGLAQARMPFWRVVAECRPSKPLRFWPVSADVAVTALFVWARTSEEAEGLAALALEEEGLSVATADASKIAPAARARRTPAVIARTDFAFLRRMHSDEPLAPPPRRGARA